MNTETPKSIEQPNLTAIQKLLSLSEATLVLNEDSQQMGSIEINITPENSSLVEGAIDQWKEENADNDIAREPEAIEEANRKYVINYGNQNRLIEVWHTIGASEPELLQVLITSL